MRQSHGMAGTPTYSSWKAMHARCKNKNDSNYGGRGITICKRWLLFTNFLQDMGLRPEGTTLDRRKVDRNYTKANCRWATQAEQSVNRRNNRWITFRGKRRTLTDWARHFGITFATLHRRLSYMPITRAMQAGRVPRLR